MITFTDVGKTYDSWKGKRAVRALDGVTFNISPGEVIGIAGPNGAGKSTLLNILLGYLAPTRGQISIDGKIPARFVAERGVAYVPEVITFPRFWTVGRTLRRLAALDGFVGIKGRERVAQVLEVAGLTDHVRKRTRQLSKGLARRLVLAQCLLSESDLVVFDEPIDGLDPVWVQKFRTMVSELRRAGRVIFIASHNLAELERVTDRVVIFDKGKVVRVVGGRHSGASLRYRIVFAAPFDAVEGHFDGLAVESTGDLEYMLVGELESMNRGLQSVIAAGALVKEFAPHRQGLESAFLEAIESDGAVE